MKYRQMGRWGVRLSGVGLGSYPTIGFKCTEEESRDTIRAAYDNGVNFFDTANAYSGDKRGEAERVLGKYLGELDRSSLFLVTKVWAPMGNGPNDRGLSAKHIFEQCHASLKRLNMDYVDLYMCHRPDPETPLDETLRAMEDLARQGKILYWGVSEWPAPMLVKANALAREIGCAAHRRHSAAIQPALPLSRDPAFPHAGGGGHRVRVFLAAGARDADGQVQARAARAGRLARRRPGAERGHQEALLDRREHASRAEAREDCQGDGRDRRPIGPGLVPEAQGSHQRHHRCAARPAGD